MDERATLPCRLKLRYVNVIMRLAFLTSLVPTGRPDTGFEIANESILDGLASIGADITIFGYHRAGDQPDPARKIITLSEIAIETAQASLATKLRWIGESIRSGLPLSSAKLRLMDEHALMRTIEDSGPFDGIIVNTAQMAGAFPGILARWPSMLIAHNIEHLSAQQNATHSSGTRRFIYQREARLLEQLEHKAIAASRHVYFLSAEDQGILGHAAISSSVLTLLAPEADHEAHAAKAFDIGLIGTWSWAPNAVGLRWFLNEVAPLLPQGLSIGLAGRLPDDFGPLPSGVHRLGRVPDAAAFVRSCGVMALTSRIGTGIQLKTIEIMQLGWPAMATSSSLRGMAYRPANLVVADEPESYAAALAKMLGNMPQPIDPSAFASAQRNTMATALKEGLAALKT
jgi:hypothetical protein